jgi:hypothetical protein
MKCRIENLIRAESPPAVAAQIVASSRNAIFYRVEYRRNPAGARHGNAREGSFALAYPLSRQSRAGIGYKPGKSDAPFGAENISTVRACVAGGGWRRLQRRQWVRRVLPIFNIHAGIFYS